MTATMQTRLSLCEALAGREEREREYGDCVCVQVHFCVQVHVLCVLCVLCVCVVYMCVDGCVREAKRGTF